MRAFLTRWRTDAEFRDTTVISLGLVLIVAARAAGWLP